jgi:prolyl-tRNA synthetase
LSVAPYEVAIIPLISKNDNSNLEKANNIYKHLTNKDIDSIIDDTDENFSSKMKKFNLIGIPYQILLGKKSEGNFLEFRELGKDPQNLSIEQITKFLTEQKEKI